MFKSSSSKYLWPVLTLFILCLFSYSNAMTHGFLLDDYRILLTRIAEKNLNLSFFTTTVDAFYRPIGAIFIKLSYVLLGAHPFGYHVINLILFFIICTLFFFLIHSLYLASNTDREDPAASSYAIHIAFIAACLYAVHPINNMIVNYKTASMLAMFIICMQISFISFTFFIQKRSKYLYLISIFFYALSLLSHEISSILPSFLLISACYLMRIRFRTALLWLAPYFLVFGIYLLIRASISHTRHIDTLFHLTMPISIYWATLADLFNWYIEKLLLPNNLLFLWDVPIHAKNLFARCSILFIYAGVIAGSFYVLIQSKKRFETYCLMFFLIGFLPLGLAAFTYTPATNTALIEPHWFYFSSISFFILLASLFLSISKKWDAALKITILGGLLLSLALMTRQSNIVWKSETTYCVYWIKLNQWNATPTSALMRKRNDPAILNNLLEELKKASAPSKE